VSHQEKSPDESSRPSVAQVEEAESNLSRCLEAYDRQGEAGLAEELNRIHPSARGRLHRVSMGGPFRESYSQVLVPNNAASSTPAPKTGPK